MSTNRFWMWGPYAALVLTVGVLCYARPRHNWDMVGYIASAVKSADFEQIHRATYAAIQTSVTPQHFWELTASNDYVENLYENPAHLAETVPFYSIKPLYVLAIQALHFLRIPFVPAMMLVSIFSYFFLAWLLWKWIGWPAYILVVAPPIIGLVRLLSPDAFAIALTLSALYLICERQSFVPGSALILAAVWCRTDLLIFAGFIFFALLVVRKLDLVEFGVLSSLALISYWAINHFAGNYGWAVLFQNTFIGLVNAPGEQLFHITPRLYVATTLRNLTDLEEVSSILLFVSVAALAIRFHRDNIYKILTLATLPAIVIHYVAYPTTNYRYFAPMLLFQLVALICSMKPLAKIVPWGGWKLLINGEDRSIGGIGTLPDAKDVREFAWQTKETAAE